MNGESMDFSEMRRCAGILSSTLTSVPFRAAYRAAGLLAFSAFVASNLQHWIQLSLRISPLLAINVVITSVYILGRMWKKYSPDVNATTIRLILLAVEHFQQYDGDLFIFTDDNENEQQQNRKRSRRKCLRMVVLYLMVQACLEPLRNLTWLYSMVAYAFSEDIIFTAISEYTKWRDGTDQPHTVSNSYFRIKLLTCMFRVTVVFSVLYYQYTHMESHYIIVTASYYIISQGYIERKATSALETLQLDFFEGLEQHYVMGLSAIVSIVYAAVFMIWSLMLNKQLLMLLALYTNVYMGARELLKSTIALAITEWATIALFERATAQELREHDDICAICLSIMSSARKTPCGHYFHGHCLRRCLKQKRACPMCNSLFQNL